MNKGWTNRNSVVSVWTRDHSHSKKYELHFLLWMGLNKSKSYLIWLGPWRNRSDNPHQLKITRTLNNLGIAQGYYIKLCEERHIDGKINKMRTCFRLWTGRDKILIAKTGGISSLVYSFTHTRCPFTLIKTIQWEVNKFIWEYSTAKVGYMTLIQGLVRLGRNALDVESSQKGLRLAWLSRMIKNRKWCSVINNYLKPMGVHYSSYNVILM